MFLLLGSSYIGHSQYYTVGVNIKTHHFKRLNHKGEKYQEWNWGVSVGHTTKEYISLELAVGRNSWNKTSILAMVGKRVGDWEGQIAVATGYRVAGHPWLRPGYFVNYQANNIKLRANHLIVTGGLYTNFNID